MDNTQQVKTSKILSSFKRKIFYLVLAHGYYVLTKVVNKLEEKLRRKEEG